MRTEKEMFELILDVARKNEKIRAVYMNGSRANPNANKDIFQDYDIVYVVTNILPFTQNESWIDVFGELIICQQPDKLDKIQGMAIDFTNRYAYLMQFADGNRIDLTLIPISQVPLHYGSDTLTVPLLDKDNHLSPLPEPSDQGYWTQKPTYAEYYSTCNEFWWVAPYCAKGLFRDELLYSIDMLNLHIRKELLKMLAWYVAYEHDFKINLGKSYKEFKHHLNHSLYQEILQTFNTTTIEDTWDSLLSICKLFHDIAPKLGKLLGYDYNLTEATKSYSFIVHIHNLPKDATCIY